MIESADEFVRLRTSAIRDEYLRAAHEPASSQVWFDVIERYPEMRSWVAHNKSVPIEVLVVLAGDPDVEVRLSVAMKRKLTVELFDQLANDPDESVRRGIAYNPKVPMRVLEQLAQDPSQFVRAGVREVLACI